MASGDFIVKTEDVTEGEGEECLVLECLDFFDFERVAQATWTHKGVGIPMIDPSDPNDQRDEVPHVFADIKNYMLTICEVQQEDGGVYTCRGTKKDGQKFVKHWTLYVRSKYLKFLT